MMNYYIYDKQVNIVSAIIACGGARKFKELKDFFLNRAGKEYTFHINGKNLTFEYVK